jgi:hypothetical protein
MENNALGKEDVSLPIIGVLLCYFENKRSSHLLATMSCRPTICIGRPHNAMNIHSRHMIK